MLDISLFEKYSDAFGFIQIKSNGERGITEQNGALCTADFIVILMSEDGNYRLSKILVAGLLDRMDPMRLGRPLRFPGSTEIDSMDNMTGWFVMMSAAGNYHTSYLLGVTPSRVHEREEGERNHFWFKIASFFKLQHFNWNNQDPFAFSFRGWFGRSPGFMGLRDYLLFRSTSWFRAIALWIGQMTSLIGSRQSTSGKRLAFLTWQVLADRDFIWKQSYKLWTWCLHRIYPEGMADVYAIWYQSEDHPVVRYYRGKYAQQRAK